MRIDTLQSVHVQVCFCQQLLELGVLALQFLETLGVGRFHAAELGPPLVERGVAEAAFAAQLLDGHPRFGLFEEANDLFFRESALLHVRHSPWFDGLLYFRMVRLAGGRSGRQDIWKLMTPLQAYGGLCEIDVLMKYEHWSFTTQLTQFEHVSLIFSYSCLRIQKLHTSS